MITVPDVDLHELIEKTIASAFGLDHYKYLIERLPKVDISKDVDYFQKTFNYYYRVRRGETWRKHYYDYFQESKSSSVSFADIITYLYGKTEGMIEPSFSSKMYATLNTDKPIWDQNVLDALNLKLTGIGMQRLNNAIDLYKRIETWYNEFVESKKGKEWIAIFDKVLPSYKEVSNIKKIDCFLWRAKKAETTA